MDVVTIVLNEILTQYMGIASLIKMLLDAEILHNSLPIPHRLFQLE